MARMALQDRREVEVEVIQVRVGVEVERAVDAAVKAGVEDIRAALALPLLLWIQR